MDPGRWHYTYPHASDYANQYAAAGTSLGNYLAELSEKYKALSAMCQNFGSLKNEGLAGGYYDDHYCTLVDNLKGTLERAIDDLGNSITTLSSRIIEVNAGLRLWLERINERTWIAYLG